ERENALLFVATSAIALTPANSRARFERRRAETARGAASSTGRSMNWHSRQLSALRPHGLGRRRTFPTTLDEWAPARAIRTALLFFRTGFDPPATRRDPPVTPREIARPIRRLSSRGPRRPGVTPPALRMSL